MTTQTSGWKSAFSAFLDRRALIMLFLGFSAGIPILLIFSSLSLWLGEAGISRSAVTFFSWAALGYSFKFVWAPLIDELPVPWLTQKLGRRRAWLLIAQLLIIVAIAIMAFSDPALGQPALYQMAVGAVLLGFAAATQDIVIDAYRIELAEIQFQTILASTYNAGYRIGMIVAGAGALFLAAYLGTAKGNYIYSAWQWTYLAMAAVMIIGVITTLVIREPQVDRVRKNYVRSDYFRLVAVFFVAVASFVLSYIYSGKLLVQPITTQFEIKDTFALFCFEALRFIGSAVVAFTIGSALVKMGAVNKQMAYETWVNPVADFFKRYGIKLALVLLLLIGFYRVSDIIAGVISNVFYQDLNFSKEQIAEAVKVYGVIFSLIGGFLGGLLAQKINIMKLMFLGAILASCTNLIFIGLVKSGEQLSPVQISVAGQNYTANADETGYWKLQIPTAVLAQAQHLTVTVNYANVASASEAEKSRSMPYLLQSEQNQLNILPVTTDNTLSLHEHQGSIVLRGQYFGSELSATQRIIFMLNNENFDAKIDAQGVFSSAIPAQKLLAAPVHTVTAMLMEGEQVILQRHLNYQVSQDFTTAQDLDVDIQPITLIDPTQTELQEITGKVIKPYSRAWLYFAIIVDNLAAGLAGAAFIAFLSSLTSVSFTAVQYAIFSSLMTLTPKIMGGYSGTIVNNIGYPKFFLMTTLIGIPVLILVLWVTRLLREHSQKVQ